MTAPRSGEPAARGDARCLACGAAGGTGEACPACGFALHRGADGILRPREEAAAGASDREVAYPEEGNELTMKVEDASFWFAHRNRVLASLLERFPVEGALWDVGGGNGFQARFLEERGIPVVLVEPGPAGCRNARGRGVQQVVEGTLQALHLPEGRLAAISLFDVLEHLSDAPGMLAECRRVLRPGGRLFVTVPAFGFLWSDEDVYARHERRYTRAALVAELRRAGFRVEFASYYFQFLLLPVFLLRTLPYRLMPWKRGRGNETMDPTEHTPSRRSLAVMKAFLDRELARIRAGKPLRFGSSVVAVVRKD